MLNKVTPTQTNSHLGITLPMGTSHSDVLEMFFGGTRPGQRHLLCHFWTQWCLEEEIPYQTNFGGQNFQWIKFSGSFVRWTFFTGFLIGAKSIQQVGIWYLAQQQWIYLLSAISRKKCPPDIIQEIVKISIRVNMYHIYVPFKVNEGMKELTYFSVVNIQQCLIFDRSQKYHEMILTILKKSVAVTLFSGSHVTPLWGGGELARGTSKGGQFSGSG